MQLNIAAGDRVVRACLAEILGWCFNRGRLADVEPGAVFRGGHGGYA